MIHIAKLMAHKLRSPQRPQERPTTDVNPDSNLLYAHRCHAGHFQRWRPVSAATSVCDVGGLAKGLFQPPGFVAIGSSVFDLRSNGVYRFYRLARLSEQRIVWQGNLDVLLSMLGYLWIYGSLNDPEDRGSVLSTIRRRVIAGTCFRLASVAAELLADAGVTARVVAFVTLDSWGGRDDRHTLVEVQSPDSDWFLYDPSFNLCFVENGRRLSLVNAVESLRRERATLEHLPGTVGHGPFNMHRLGHSFWVDERIGSNDILYDWYRRLAGLPLVHDNGIEAFSENGLSVCDQERFSRRYRMMSHEAFVARFYGGRGVRSRPPWGAR